MMADEELEMLVDFRQPLVTYQGAPARVVCTNRRCPRGRYRYIILWECGNGDKMFERSVTVDSFGKNCNKDRVIMNLSQFIDLQERKKNVTVVWHDQP